MCVPQPDHGLWLTRSTFPHHVQLAYIKPATQCVTATLTARFCESKGILYRHIGPVVFYKGFSESSPLSPLSPPSPLSPLVVCRPPINRSAGTWQCPLCGCVARQFLDGQAGTSAELVASCVSAVDRVAADRKIVVIDGVGYPSVGYDRNFGIVLDQL